MGDTPKEWYMSLRIVTRSYATAAVATTAAVSLGLVKPYLLMLNWNLVLYKFQFWRLLTSFLFFGPFSLPFVFSIFILVRYAQAYEVNPYPSGGGTREGNSADMLVMLLFGVLVIGLAGGLGLSLPFLAQALSFMILYVWARRNPDADTSFWGFKFKGFYLPWVFMGFSILVGGSPVMDLLGIAAGHLYYFLQEVLPATHNLRLLQTPQFLTDLMDVGPSDAAPVGGGWRQAAPRPAGHNWGDGHALGGNQHPHWQ